MGGGRGKGPGTGSPLTFRCAKCKLGDWRNSARGTRWEATGRIRNRYARHSGIRHDNRRQAEYRCLDCRHVGWSRHGQVIWHAEARQ